MTQIDWNRELKKVERAFDGLPPEPSAEERRAKHAAEQRELLRRKERAAAIGAWVRLTLVTILAVSLNFWPYPHSCGFGLFAFLGSEGLVLAGGLWVATITFRARMPMTHVLALLMSLSALALLELEVLPRVGYAKAEAVWSCPAAVAAPQT
jgi:hypothetical protein